MVFTGYIVGRRCEETFGCEDYEWNLVVAPSDKPRVLDLLILTKSGTAGQPTHPADGGLDDRLLAALHARYAGDDKAYTHFEEWLKANGIKYGTSSWRH